MRSGQIEPTGSRRHRRAGGKGQQPQFRLTTRRRTGLRRIKRLIVSTIVRRLHAERAGKFERLAYKLVRLGQVAAPEQWQPRIVGHLRRDMLRDLVLYLIIADERIALATTLSFKVSKCLDRYACLANAGAGGEQDVLWASPCEVVFN